MVNSSEEDYSKNGMQTRVWGPAGWVFLHCIAQNYPTEPSTKQKKEYLDFFKCVGNVLPCRYCRESYQQFIKEKDTQLNITVMENRTTFSKWLYLVHDKVNKKLGVTSITFKQVTDKYESFRSKCTKSPTVKVHGCTNPPKNGSLRSKCKIKFVTVDENGKEFSFGKSKKIKLISIKKSKKQGKKYTATFEIDGRKKIVHFGAKGMRDFTIKGHRKDRMKLYRQRHRKDLKTKDPTRAGFLSMFILWNKPSLSSSIRDYRRRLNIYNTTHKFPINF